MNRKGFRFCLTVMLCVVLVCDVAYAAEKPADKLKRGLFLLRRSQENIAMLEMHARQAIAEYDQALQSPGAALALHNLDERTFEQELARAYLRSAAFHYGYMLEGVYTSFYIQYFFDSLLNAYGLGVDAGLYKEFPDDKVLVILFRDMQEQDPALELTLKFLSRNLKKPYEAMDQFWFFNTCINACFVRDWTDDFLGRPVNKLTVDAFGRALTSMMYKVDNVRSQRAHLAMARLCLFMLQRNVSVPTDVSGLLSRELQAANLTLAVMGITKADIQKYERSCSEASARQYVSMLRWEDINKIAVSYCLFADSQDAGVSLMSLGLTKKEAREVETSFKKLKLVTEKREKAIR